MDNRLQRLFQETKARKEKERQKKKQQRQEAYKQLCKKADKLLKEAQEQEKKKKMEQLQALVKKTPQKPLIQVSRHITVYHSNLIDREKPDEKLYTTREQLKEAEQRGEGAIRWDVFNKLVEETRKWNEEHFKH